MARELSTEEQIGEVENKTRETPRVEVTDSSPVSTTPPDTPSRENPIKVEAPLAETESKDDGKDQEDYTYSMPHQMDTVKESDHEELANADNKDDATEPEVLQYPEGYPRIDLEDPTQGEPGDQDGGQISAKEQFILGPAPQKPPHFSPTLGSGDYAVIGEVNEGDGQLDRPGAPPENHEDSDEDFDSLHETSRMLQLPGDNVKIVVIDESQSGKVKKLTIDEDMNVTYKEQPKIAGFTIKNLACVFAVVCVMVLSTGLILALATSSWIDTDKEMETISISLDTSYQKPHTPPPEGWIVWQTTNVRLLGANSTTAVDTAGSGEVESKDSDGQPSEVVDGTWPYWSTILLFEEGHRERWIEVTNDQIWTFIRGCPAILRLVRQPADSHHETEQTTVLLADPTSPSSPEALVSMRLKAEEGERLFVSPAVGFDGQRAYVVFNVYSNNDILSGLHNFDDVEEILGMRLMWKPRSPTN